MLLRRALNIARVGVPIQFARDGYEAINALAQTDNHSVLLLLDLKMPRVDGFEVLEWLNHQEFAHQVSVVILSSSGETEDIKRAGSLGARAYIVKPTDPYELVRVVERVNDLWGLQSAEPQPCAIAA
jgi:two-component system, response regulator